VSFSGCNRPRSPVTTEADIYGYNATDPNRRPNGVDSRQEPKKTIENGKPPSAGFDNPMYKKFSAASAVVQPLDYTPVFVGRNGEMGMGIRKASSTSSAIPGFPSVLILDESSDDHRRLVPNDMLSLEIDRGQRWLRDNREARRHVYETEQKAKDAADDLPSILNQELTIAENADGEDAKSKTLPQPPARKKLRRRLAETIANDRVLETTVTFTSEIDSPVSASPPFSQFTNSSHLLGGNGEKRIFDIKRKHDSDDDDLEVIFKERTPL